MSRLDDILAKPQPEPGDLADLLAIEDPAEQERLHAAAYAVKAAEIGKVVHLRGLIELSNVCRKDCLYCGIRRSNGAVARYSLSDDEVLELSRWAHAQGYGSVVIQSGERSDPAFVARITALVKAIRAESRDELAITLSLGEQSEATYREWHEAGAERYLLRIETSNPDLYRRLHPPDHLWEVRRDCLRALRAIGYQLGSGVMIGLPGQTPAELAEDIRFFEREGVVMIGMGPFIPHAETPLGENLNAFTSRKQQQLLLALRMIAATRLYLRDVNIAATTALQALAPNGRELGLSAGGNVIMPNLTAPRYRSAYLLYDGKPCLDEAAEQCRGCLESRIAAVGERIGYRERGDSPRFLRWLRSSRPRVEQVDFTESAGHLRDGGGSRS
jgi:biotin synthase